MAVRSPEFLHRRGPNLGRRRGTRSPNLVSGCANTVPNTSCGGFRRGVVDSFAEAQFQFIQPSPRVKTVNESAQKAEPFGYVASVVANVVLRDAPVDGQKLRYVDGLREEVSRVAELRRFYDHRRLKIENVFRPKHVQAARALTELLSVEAFIIWLPCYFPAVVLPTNA